MTTIKSLAPALTAVISLCGIFTAAADTYVPEAPSHQSSSYDEVNNIVTITATAPTKTEYDWDDWYNPQKDLPYISYVLIERHVQNTPWPDNAEVGRVENPALGQPFSFEDATVERDRKYDYRLTCYVDNTRGQYSSYVNVYTGVTPGELQAFSASVADHLTDTVDITVTAPALTANGNALTAPFSIQIVQYADWTETVIHTIEDARAGETYQWQHSGLQMNQAYHYRAYAMCGTTGRGSGSEADTYVGLDVPAEPRDLVVIPEGNAAHLQWQQPICGYYGGAYNPEATTYTIRRKFNDGTLETAAVGVAATEYLDDPGFDEAVAVAYVVTAVNDAGESFKEATHAPVSFGPPAAIPFAESFASQIMAHRGWTTESSQDDEYYTYKAWQFMGASSLYYYPTDEYIYIDAQDNDEGLAQCLFYGYSPDGQTESLITPPIDTVGVGGIDFSFYFYEVCSEASKNDINVYISRDNAEWELLYSREPMEEFVPSWTEARFTAITNETSSVRFKISAVRHNGPIIDVFIDNINIVENPQYSSVSPVAVSSDVLPEYFTLDGRRISGPSHAGIYIVRRGNNTDKVLVK